MSEPAAGVKVEGREGGNEFGVSRSGAGDAHAIQIVVFTLDGPARCGDRPGSAKGRAVDRMRKIGVVGR